MKRFRILTTLLLSIALLTPVRGIEGGPSKTPGEKEKQILVEYYIFRVGNNLSGDTSLDENIWAGENPPEKDAKRTLTPFTKAQFRLGTERLDVKDNEWFWNDQLILGPQNEDNWSPTNKAIGLVARPRVLARDGAKVMISMDSNQSIEYFERTLGGLFKLKKYTNPVDGISPRLSLEVTPSFQKDGRILLSDFAVSLNTVVKREPIEGVSLPVGKPIFSAHRYTADLLVREGKGYGFILGPGDGQGVLIIWLTVKTYDEEIKPVITPKAQKEDKTASIEKSQDEKKRITPKGESSC